MRLPRSANTEPAWTSTVAPTSRRRALSLIEVIVVAALFAGAMTAFTLVQMAVSKQSKKTTRDTEVQDSLALTMEAVKRDLRGARLVGWQVATLRYRTPVIDDQQRLIPGSTGLIQFLPQAPDSYRLAMDNGDGWLKRHGPNDPPRRMGRLGTSGSLTVAAVTASSSDLLRLTFTCRLVDLQRQGQLQIYFANQL